MQISNTSVTQKERCTSRMQPHGVWASLAGTGTRKEFFHRLKFSKCTKSKAGEEGILGESSLDSKQTSKTLKKVWKISPNPILDYVSQLPSPEGAALLFPFLSMVDTCPSGFQHGIYNIYIHIYDICNSCLQHGLPSARFAIYNLNKSSIIAILQLRRGKLIYSHP